MSDVISRLAEGCERITWRSWPGAPEIFIGIRPLSEPEWNAVAEEARARVIHAGERERSYLQTKAERRAIIVRCVVVREDGVTRPALTEEDVSFMDESTVADLYRSIELARDSAHGIDEWPNAGRVMDELERVYSRKTMGGVVMRLRAKHAGLCGFYGVSNARVLTDWQVLIYARLVREED